MHDKTENGSARARAAETILDRAWDRTSATMELTGTEGGPIQVKDAKEELAGIIAGIVARTKTDDAAGEPH